MKTVLVFVVGVGAGYWLSNHNKETIEELGERLERRVSDGVDYLTSLEVRDTVKKLRSAHLGDPAAER